jgi:glycosyltransferase involved in cell wall biosynthesis
MTSADHQVSFKMVDQHHGRRASTRPVHARPQSRPMMAANIPTLELLSVPPPIVRSAVGSVVISAYNEATVIGRGLGRLHDSLGTDIEVIVVCNGCTDGTADAVRRTGHAVRVIELGVASKAKALRAADDAATAFPRVYLDADVLVSGKTIRAVVRHLRRPGALAARPPLVYDTSSGSWVVRRFYRARARLPAVMGSLWGAGLYALSAEGHARLGVFPHVVADDLFVDRLFRPDEIDVVAADPVVVVAPATTSGLLASLRRVVRGNRDLRALPAHGRPLTAGTVRDLVRLARRGPAESLDALVYASLVMSARVLARRRRRAPHRWERDETTRR